MLELVGMLPTLLELSMLPSVRLRLRLMLSQRLMLVCTMEDMAMVLVWDMLDLDIPVLDMLDMVVMDLAMAVSAMLVLATMARGLLMLSQRLTLVCTMEDMAMVLDLDIPVLDMVVMVLDMEDMVLDMDVPSMVKQLIYASKSSKVLFNYSVPSACLFKRSSAVCTSRTCSLALRAILVVSTHCCNVFTPLVNNCIPAASSSLLLLSLALFSNISHFSCTSLVLCSMFPLSAGKLSITSCPSWDTCPTLSLIGASSLSIPLCFRCKAFTVVKSLAKSSISNFSDFSVIQSQTSSQDF